MHYIALSFAPYFVIIAYFLSMLYIAVLYHPSHSKKAEPPPVGWRLRGVGYSENNQKLMTPSNFSAAREAPPMRPPSISGWAMRSWAFLAFIEPP